MRIDLALAPSPACTSGAQTASPPLRSRARRNWSGGGMKTPLQVMRSLLFALASVMSFFALAPAASAQGGGGVIRDAEIEQILREWGTPIWRAAGLNPNDV